MGKRDKRKRKKRRQSRHQSSPKPIRYSFEELGQVGDATTAKYSRAAVALYDEPVNITLAIQLLSELVAEEPETALFYWSLGFAYGEQHEFDKAITALQHALTLDPKSGPALGCLGVTYMRLKRWADAKPLLEAKLALRPNAQDYVFLSIVEHNLNHDDLAIAAYTAARQLDPTSYKVVTEAELAAEPELTLDD